MTGSDRLSCGVDVVAIERVESLLDRFEGSFADRVFTDRERRYCRSRPHPPQHFAARWAAKEATRKVLPETGQAIPYRDVGVVHEGDEPRVEYSGAARDAVEDLGDVRTALSLSHDRTLGQATAQVVLLGGDRRGEP